MNKVIFVIGVSGCGKSTIGKIISKEFNIPFFDADDYHPESNIKKMTAGQSLNDADRFDWLNDLNKLASKQIKKTGCVIACSALKQKYRTQLSQNIERKCEFIHLYGTYNEVLQRLKNRNGHFMPNSLLKSQFETLEYPEDALNINIKLSPIEIMEKIKHKLIQKSQIGLFGLGVMGKSLCRNLSNNGFNISMYNRHVDGVEEDIAKNFKSEFKELSNAQAFDDLEKFVDSLNTPRCIMLMVNSGKTVDIVIENLLPFLSKNDIIIDGGNSNYKKTNERYLFLKKKNIHFIGAGVSGGEKGALNGPSIMPSGSIEAYQNIKPYLEKISAKDKNQKPCCTYIGEEGSGHFIKTIHNGIEYVEMQLLAEVTTILEAKGFSLEEIANILGNWKNDADSYLLEITSKIFRKKEAGEAIVKLILDKAGNKGTGNWATIASAELGLPSTLIASALFSRYISFYKDERIENSKKYIKKINVDIPIGLNEILEAYQFSRIINHYQGFKLIFEASNSYNWNLNLSEIARIWTNGCIIKSTLMEDLVEIFKSTNNLLSNSEIINQLNKYNSSIKNLISQCVLNDITIPCFSESLQFFNGITTGYSSANVIQAQRDFFGAHTYQKLNDNSNINYHTNWEQD